MVLRNRKMSQNIILTTGIYDLIKDHIKSKKVTPTEEENLKLQLKNAKQLTRKNLPDDVVDIEKRVTVKNLDNDLEETYVFVAPDKAKKRNKTESILTQMGLALVGWKVGDVINWDFEEGEKNLEIMAVESRN
ncbi:greA/GreB family elongation factor [Flavobacterium frigoris PS1]|uniref:GreA/GreB family elongation factor n=2 Tax=Flavobacterium frigoris TaxID=229204 RepID=H7FRA2_FLAFP|nr:greA/GreB family elongation factor [Flavobacterium frigoris PS1]